MQQYKITYAYKYLDLYKALCIVIHSLNFQKKNISWGPSEDFTFK